MKSSATRNRLNGTLVFMVLVSFLAIFLGVVSCGTTGSQTSGVETSESDATQNSGVGEADTAGDETQGMAESSSEEGPNGENTGGQDNTAEQSDRIYILSCIGENIFTTPDFQVFSVNPLTGECEDVAYFPLSKSDDLGGVKVEGEYLSLKDDIPLCMGQCMSDDFQRLLVVPRNRSYGFVDNGGEFVELKSILREGGDFGSMAYGYHPRLVGDYLIYIEEDTGVWRVPVDNPNPKNAELISPNEPNMFESDHYVISPDMSAWAIGSFSPDMSAISSEKVWCDWVDNSTYLCTKNDRIALARGRLVEPGSISGGYYSYFGDEFLAPSQYFGDSEEKFIFLTPEVKGRDCASPRLSPDGKSFAFISWAKDEGSTKHDLFIAPFNQGAGGDPVRVNVDPEHAELLVDSVILDWR